MTNVNKNRPPSDHISTSFVERQNLTMRILVDPPAGAGDNTLAHERAFYRRLK